jgi:hypothetical protein
MKTITSISILSVIIALVVGGCANVGTSSPFPLPRVLSGSISGDIYTSNNGVFAVRTPFTAHEYMDRTAEIKELDVPFGKYVSFGPSLGDPRIFRVEVVTENPPGQMSASMIPYAEQAFQPGINQIERAYKTPLRKVVMREEVIDGYRAVFAFYEQDIPQGHREYGRHPENIMYQCLYLIDYVSYAAICGVESTYHGDKPWSETKEYIKEHDDADARAFAASVSIVAKKKVPIR